MPVRYATTAAFAILAASCASADSAPFHVYRSPLLAAETTVTEPADREYDPAQPGDYPAPERVVAQSDEDAWESQPQEQQSTAEGSRKRSKKRFFSLAIGGRDDEPSGSADGSQFVARFAAQYVWRTFEINGVDLPQSAQHDIATMWETCRAAGRTSQKTALPGDAVFFHNVVDANGDGRNNDWYAHVGIVEKVRSDGAARVLSYVGGEVIGSWIDPTRPEEIGTDEAPVNSRLRIPTADDPPFTQYYAGQLFAGYCSMLDARAKVVVMDEWEPTR